MSVSRHGKSKEGGVHRNANGAERGLSPQILLTKLKRPPVAPDIFPRPRLLDRLNEGRQRTLTLISAPAGCGKSTLASRWLAACDCPGGWVSLDESDSEPRVFLSYVLAAVRSLFPKTALQTEALLEANPLPPAPVLAHHLLNDLNQITEPSILVLDDYHHIRGGSPVHELLTEFLAHPPLTMHLVLLTRRDPALPISRLRGRGQLAEIRAADLRFTPAEAAGFLNKMLKVPVDDATAALLEKKTEGWATGLRLAGLYLRDQDDPKQRVEELSGSSWHIAEYLAAEVLSKQAPEIVDYLLETSILDRFCAPLCGQMHRTGTQRRSGKPEIGAEQFIRWLVEANLFVIALDDQGYWFRYHHLFRDFLQNRLRKQTNADTIAKLYMQASQWFAQNGLIDEAIRYALLGRNIQAAVRLVIEHRYQLMNTLQFQRLHSWLALLPEDAVAQAPLLVGSLSLMGLERGLDYDLHSYIDQVQRLLTALPDKSIESSTLQGEIAAIQSVGFLIRGPSSAAFAAGQKALQKLPENALFFRSLAIGAMAASRQMEGDLTQGLKLLDDTLAESTLPAALQVRTCFHICAINFLDVNSSAILQAGLESLRIAQASRLHHAKSYARYFLGAVHYLRNELSEAKSYLLDILEDRQVSHPTYVAHACGILMLIYLSEGCPLEAGQVINEISKKYWGNQDTSYTNLREALRVELMLRQGKFDEAHRRSAGIDFNKYPPVWRLYVPQLTHIKLLLAEGTDEGLKEARTRLVDLDERMRRLNRKSVRIDTLALLALVCQKQGEEAAALENLQAALGVAEPGGWVRNFVDLGDPMTDLLEHLSRTRPGQTFATQVLDTCHAEIRSGPPSRPSGQVCVTMLSKREIEILPLLAEGLSNKEIAARLHLAPVTVKTHLQNIYKKLNTKNRIEALKKSREIGIINNK